MGRLAREVGPEPIAAILSVAVIAVALFQLVWLPRQGDGPGALPSAPGVAVVSPTPAPSATGPDGPTEATAAPTPSAAASTGSPAPTGSALPAAVALIRQLNADILPERTVLEAAVARRDAALIAQSMRRLNTALRSPGPLVDALSATPGYLGAASRLGAAYRAVTDATTITLRFSLASTRAYLDGAADVLAAIATIAEVDASLDPNATSAPSLTPSASPAS